MEQMNALSRFKEFILTGDHPCLMSQAVTKRNEVELQTYGEFTGRETITTLLKDLDTFINSDAKANNYRSFVAVFDQPETMSEQQFEDRLWKLLQKLHEADPKSWDPKVSSDPASGNFSFSLLGRAFYVVGLHPGSSRKARRFFRPALVFNLHEQFTRLRETGKYEQVRDKIRMRDQQFQGSVNPMLEDFGETSEARQYSGRAVDQAWKCPFHAMHGKQNDSSGVTPKA